jgi:O-antigen/teichoic acid export membrane protein
MSVKSIASTYCPLFLRPVFNRIVNSPIGYRLASGVFWSTAGAVISRGLMLAAWVLVARMLGKTGYGELGMIQSTVGMFGVFAGFGLGLTATKHVAEFRRSNPDKVCWIMMACSLLRICSCFFIDYYDVFNTLNFYTSNLKY